MAMGMGPQAGHDVFVRRLDDENCCNLAQCRITYYIFLSVLSAMACIFALLVLFSGLQWMGLLVTDLVILGILWGTFCCVYGCCFRTKLVIHSAGAPQTDPAVGVQLAYPAYMHPAPGVVQQGYPVPHIVHQGYPVQGQQVPPAPAPAPSWPTPFTPPGPKVQHTPFPGPFPQSQTGSSSWQAPPAP